MNKKYYYLLLIHIQTGKNLAKKSKQTKKYYLFIAPNWGKSSSIFKWGFFELKKIKSKQTKSKQTKKYYLFIAPNLAKLQYSDFKKAPKKLILHDCMGSKTVGN